MINFLRNMFCNQLLDELKDYKSRCDDLKYVNDVLNAKISDLYNENNRYREALGAYFYVFEDTKPISKRDLWAVMRPIMKTPNIHFADNWYKTCSRAEMEEWLELDNTATRKFYQTEAYDCDDFAKRLIGNMATQANANIALFTVWSGRHAFNAFVDNNRKLWYIEPQTGVIFDPEDPNLPSQYTDIRICIG